MASKIDQVIQETEEVEKKKCQKRQNKQCIEVSGTNIYYTTINDLAKKLNIPIEFARDLVNDSGRRIILDKNTRDTMLINVKKDKPTKVLKQLFKKKDGTPIKNIARKTLITGKTPRNLDIIISKEVPDFAVVKVLVTINLYLDFPSNSVEMIDIIDWPHDYKYESKYFEEALQYINPVKIDEVFKEKKYSLRLITTNVIYNGRMKDLDDFIKRSINTEMENFRKTGGRLLYTTYNISSTYGKQTLKYEKGFLRDFDNVYELNEWCNVLYNKSGNNCVVDLVTSYCPDLYFKIKKYETKRGIKLDDFISFCKKYEVAYKIYDEQGKIKCSSDDSNYKIVAVIYNNHIYPVHGKRLQKRKISDVKIKLIENSYKEFKKMLDNKILPYNVNISCIVNNEQLKNVSSIGINSFCVNDIKYICNPEYEKCYTFLKKLGIEYYIKSDTKLTNLVDILEKHFKAPDCKTFIPNSNLYARLPYLYKNESVDIQSISKKIKTIDKNKCYPSALYNLDYLLKFDYRKNNINMNPVEIIDTNCYLITVKKSTLLIPQSGLYAGYFLNYCKNKYGIKFELLEELECVPVANYYRNIIDLLYTHLDNDIFKLIMNIHIGKFQKVGEPTYKYTYKGIYNNESNEMFEGFKKKIGEHNLIFNEKHIFSAVQNKLIISNQIKDYSRMLLNEKIIEYGIHNDNIVQINTDSISYISGVTPKFKYSSKIDEFNGWKCINFKELSYDTNIYDNELYSIKNSMNYNNNKRILHIGYAGCGKTHFIITKLIPFLERQKINYIVLTPTHATLKEYKNANVNSEIIQKYTFDLSIPKEDYIIIDEIGFIDTQSHNFLYKLNHCKKSFECFGDFNQLLAVGENLPINKDHYLKYMFNDIRNIFVNYRNNFTKDYYDSIINNKADIISEVYKYSVNDYKKAEIILCYRNKTKQQYNDTMIHQLKLKSWCDKGAKIICNNNKLIHLNICNNGQYIITNVDNKYFTLDNEYNIPIKYMNKTNFSPAYALNVHQIQGSTINNYYWCREDDFFIDGRTAYTIISRLRTKLKFNCDREYHTITQIEDIYNRSK